jgi:LPS-assembly lipoprotein
MNGIRLNLRVALLPLIAGVCLLAGCGFQLRGQASLPFDRVFVQVPPASVFGNDLKRAIRSGTQTRVVDRADGADAVLQILTEVRERQILSLSGSGRVREFQLRYRVSYRLNDPSGTREFIGPSEILLKRDLTYNDSDVLAKAGEEELLYRDMQSDAVQLLMRRLQAARIDAGTKG